MQCDQIGLFFKAACQKISLQKWPNIWLLLELFGKHYLKLNNDAVKTN